MPTLAEIDEAITRAWDTYRRAMLDGSPHMAEAAMRCVDRRLDERLTLREAIPA